MKTVVVTREEWESEYHIEASVKDVLVKIKEYLPNDHLITEVTVDGQPVADSDWERPAGEAGWTSIQAITEKQSDFLIRKLAGILPVLKQGRVELSSACERIFKGDSGQGNQKAYAGILIIQDVCKFIQGTLECLEGGDVGIGHFVAVHTVAIAECTMNAEVLRIKQSWWELEEEFSSRLVPQVRFIEDFLADLADQL